MPADTDNFEKILTPNATFLTFVLFAYSVISAVEYLERFPDNEMSKMKNDESIAIAAGLVLFKKPVRYVPIPAFAIPLLSPYILLSISPNPIVEYGELVPCCA
jgi:hypothetical protein